MNGRGLLALDCPRCGVALPGLDADIAFGCAPCGSGWELVDGRLRTIRFEQVAAALGPDPTVNVPAWYFAAKVGASPRAEFGPTATASALASRAAALTGAFVLAASLPRADVFGDWGRDWTRGQAAWRPSAERKPVAGVTLPSAEARVLAHHVLLDLIDRVHDLGDVDVEIELGEPTLLAVPATLSDARLHPAIGGVPIPLRALDHALGILDLADAVGSA